MGDFVFKNLSVKLLPAEGDAPQGDAPRDECACCSYVCSPCTNVTCGACTNTCTGCTNSCTDCSDGVTCGCTNTCTNCTECTHGPTCGPCTNSETKPQCGGCTCDQFTNPIITAADAGIKPVGDVRLELAAHKERLRQAMAQVEEQELELEARGKPKSIEEIDRLKGHFEEAIVELEAHRAKLVSDKEPGPK